MGTISVTNISDGTGIDAADVNNQVNTIVNEFNGNIDANNLKASAVTTTKITDANVTAAKMQYGMVRQRQGGTSGDGSWGTTGTSNTDTSAKAAFWQAGAINSSASADVTVTFPVAYAQVPIVLMTAQSAGSFNTGRCIVTAVTTTTFVFRNVDEANTKRAELCVWASLGQ